MSADERFEIYTRLMGGKDNLPPKLAIPPSSSHATTNSSDQPTDTNDEEANLGKVVDAFGNLQTYDDYVSAHPFPTPHAPAYDNRHAANPPRPNRVATSEPDFDIDFTLDPRKDEPSELGMSFCPFLAITKFPYKYANPALLQPIATAFFDGGKIYNRPWDL